MRQKPLIYIASPYTKGDPCINAHFQCRIFDELLDDGKVLPFIPLWTHFVHSTTPRPYEDWIEYDKVLLSKMNGVLRLNAVNEKLNYHVSESSGADGEVKFAREIGLPVFFNRQELYLWVDTVWSVA